MNAERLANFEKLDNQEQDVLIALSVIYIPIRQGYFQELLKTYDCTPDSAAKIIGKPLREKLLELNLIALTRIGWWYCPYDIADGLLQKAVARPELMQCLEQMVRSHTSYMPDECEYERKVRLLRIFFYQKKERAFLRELAHIRQTDSKHLERFYTQFFSQNFAFEWFATLPETMQLEMLLDHLSMQQLKINNSLQLFQILRQRFFACKKPDRETVERFCAINLLRGDIDGLEKLLEHAESGQLQALSGVLRFLQNRNDTAIAQFVGALGHIKAENKVKKQAGKQTGKQAVGKAGSGKARSVRIDGYPGYFFNLALFRSQDPAYLELMQKQLRAAIRQHVRDEFAFNLMEIRLLHTLELYQARKSFDHPKNTELFAVTHTTPYGLLFQVLMINWLDKAGDWLKHNAKAVQKLHEYCQTADSNGYTWYAAVGSNLLARLGAAEPVVHEIAKKHQQCAFNAIIDLVPRVAHWKRALDALTVLGSKLNQDAAVNPQQHIRMIWLVELDDDEGARLFPREQRLGKQGRWSLGRPVAIKRLREDVNRFDYLTEQDRRICNQIEVEYEEDYYSYYRREIYSLKARAVAQAAGHPNVYWHTAAKPVKPIRVIMSEPQLAVLGQVENLLIKMVPHPRSGQPYMFEKTATDDLLVYQIDASHHDVAAILTRQGLEIPQQAQQQVRDAIAVLAGKLTVQSDIGGESLHAESVTADSRLHLHLQPAGDGIQIDIVVQPFAGGGPVYKPGHGGSTVLAEIDGKQLQTTRDLELEKQYLERIIELCPALYDTGGAKWTVIDAETALEVLLQLQTMDDFTVLKWPQGKAMKISRETGVAQVHMTVRKKNDWFSLSGNVSFDDDQVIELQQLMALLPRATGRFVTLEDGQIIALTDDLRRRLNDLADLGMHHGAVLDIHRLSSRTVGELMHGMQVDSNKAWREQLNRWNDIDDFEPQLPSTLQCELRDYQLLGYQWLARLAHLGAGACLADDMGLGKTIQSLALVVSRAVDGPTLILAPTSVCNNWIEEAQRFAPTLNASYFGSGDRQELLDRAGAFDVVVCSYGLLQTEAQRLQQKHWRTIVADEAQAIKNPATQRSKAAMGLTGDFKMITTGTPIENHLGELWNLFQFINPGMLGSLNTFNARYAQDIVNDQDHRSHHAQRRLKTLLQPFILRRLKHDVLTELPARTEVTLHVELSQGEREFYEALRRDAIQVVETARADVAPAGQQYLAVLAEITRLRRACCHPQLIAPQLELSSAKLRAFEELIDELISNRHKVLVFSQFVAYLKLIRTLLDNKGIEYQYLDGATSMKNRNTAVKAFQSGQGDLFLISLKAGGAGLNLTAADYVVHMDPWWNPAVEDQASDRAHRMGQLRPVTIYRLIVKDTIEEKIVALHKHKRDLADTLLADGDVSGKMSIKAMLALLQDAEKD